MRFEQLKKDPNNIMRKKLVKSKKGWMVLASLALAGGLFWLSGPSYVVKADANVATPSTSVQTTAPEVTGKSAGDGQTISVAPKTVAVVDKGQADTLSSEQTITKKTIVNNVTSPKISKFDSIPTTNNKKINSAFTSKVAIKESVQTKDSKITTPTDSSVNTINTSIKQPSKSISVITDKQVTNPIKNSNSTAISTSKILATNLKLSNMKLASLGIAPKVLSITPETVTLSDGNLAENTFGTTPWFIDSQGILYLGSKNKKTTLDDNKTISTHKTSGDSDSETSNTATTLTSPWANHSQDINTIIFDGPVEGSADMNHMFSDLTNLKSIKNIDYLNLDNTTNIAGMFANDTNLITASNSKGKQGKHTANNQELDLSQLGFFTVKDANSLFLNDSSVTNITLPESQISTLARSRNDNYMFKNDINLKSVDVKNWQFRLPKTMLGMFQNDTNLNSLDIRTWNMTTWNMTAPTKKSDTGDSSKGEGMFDGTNLQTLILSKNNIFMSYTDLPSQDSYHWTNVETANKTNNQVISFSTMAAKDGNTLGTLFNGSSNPQFTEIDFTPKAGETVPNITTTVNIPSNLGVQQVQVTGKINGYGQASVPAITGYTPDVSVVNATILGNGKAVTNYYVTYTGNPIPKYTASIKLPDGTIKSISGTTNSNGEPVRIGDTISLDVPKIAGYDTPKVTGTVNPGRTVTFAIQPTYQLTTYTKNIKVDTNKGTQTVQIISPASKNASGTLARIPGYSLANNKVNVQVALNGTVTVYPNQSFNYIGNSFKTPTVPFTTPNDIEKVLVNDSNQKDNSHVRVGDTVTVQIPQVRGYTTPDSVGKNISEITGSINIDGNFIPDSIKATDIKYIGNNATPTIPFDLPNKKTQNGLFYKTTDFTKKNITNAQVGDKITVIIPPVAGYTTHDTKNTSADNSVSEVFGTIDSNGTFVADKSSTQLNNIKYIGDPKTPVISFNTPSKPTDGSFYEKDDSTHNYITQAKVGDEIIVEVPQSAGYDAEDSAGHIISKISGTIDSKGNFIADASSSDPKKVTYSGKIVNPDVSFNIPNGEKQNGDYYKTDDLNKNILHQAQVGEKITIKVPEVDGYYAQDSNNNKVTEITGHINTDGQFVSDNTSQQLADIKYIGNSATPTFSFKTHDNDNAQGSFYTHGNSDGTPVINAKVGDQLILKLPESTGYHFEDSKGNKITKIDGHINTAGKFESDKDSPQLNDIKYVGNNITDGTATVNGKTITGLTGIVGNTVIIPAPNVTGYTPKYSTIQGTMNSDGSVSTKQSFDYQPDTIKGSITVNTVKGKTVLINNLTGIVDKDDGVDIPAPTVTGYTPKYSTIKGTMSPKGSVSTNQSFDYQPDTIKGSITVNTVKGKTVLINNLTGIVDKDDDVEITAPNVTGYTPKHPTIKGTMSPKGSVSTNQSFDYQPDTIKGSITVNTVKGKTVLIDDLTGIVDKDDGVEITAPTVTGYTPKHSTIQGTMNPDGSVSTDQSFDYQPDTIKGSITVNTIKGKTVLIDDLTGIVDKDGGVEITAPTVTGYTPKYSTIQGTMNPDGSVSTDQSFDYQPDTIKGSITVNTIKGKTVLINDLTGIVDKDDGVEITAPNVTGYTPKYPTIKGTMSPDSSISTNQSFDYQPKTFNKSALTFKVNGISHTIQNISGTVDDINGIKIKAPDITGYTATNKSITATMNPNGTISTDQSFDYKPKTLDKSTLTFKVNGVSHTIQNISGTVDDINGIKITAPEITGYTATNKSIIATMKPDGTISTNQNFGYKPQTFDKSTLTFEVNGVSHTIQNIFGTVDDKNGIKIKAPNITGYTATNKSITATMNPDGTISTNQSFDYKPKTLDKPTLTFKVNGVSHTIQNISGTVDVKNGIKINAPEIPGYTPANSFITATMNPDGTISTDQNFGYKPDKLSNKQLTINTPNGKLTLNNISGTVDDTNGITINAPKVQGYTSTNPTITATMKPDGTVSTNQSFDYQPNQITDGTITIDTPAGKKTLTKLTGKVGDSIEVKVPNIPGYTVNVQTVKAVINPDSTLTTTDKIIYTRIPSHSHVLPIIQQPINTLHQAPEKLTQTISTYSDQPDVQIYTLGANDSMSPVTDQDLAKKTNWQSDQKITLGNDTYYRVATNEWVKANKVYPYHDNTMDIRTYDGSDKELFKAEDDLIKSRDVAADSSWFSDRIVDLNGVKYYRVATNELVKASDAYIYQPIKQVIKTHESSAGIPLYTAKGILIKNRYLASRSAWLSDSIVYISGIEYYRVATNEFVRASDVDINH